MKNKIKKVRFPYVERDISWMYFNRRILLEAEKDTVPLLERFTFLGIYSNNLDEFFRVRVATLNRIIEYRNKHIRQEQETALSTYQEIGRLNARYTQEFETTFHTVTKALEKEHIRLVKETELNPTQQD